MSEPFHMGGPITLEEFERVQSLRHIVGLDESERQTILIALAHLAVERPGWDLMLNAIALKMDNKKGGRAQLFERFKELHTEDICQQIERRHRLETTSGEFLFLDHNRGIVSIRSDGPGQPVE